MSINIDARGLACPQPVIATKKALDGITEGVVTTIVDNVVAKENVVKFAAANGCGVSVTQQDGQFYIKITKGTGKVQPEETQQSGGPLDEKLVYLISRDTLGHGSKDLGAVLMKSFLYTLGEKEPLPKAIMFINSGVQLTVEGSPVLEHLKTLASRGVSIMSCGTCLDYYKLKDKLAVGTVTNMYSIVDELSAAERAITL